MNDYQIQCGSHTLCLDRTHVMGVINLTPDAFYHSSRKKNFQDAIEQAERMLLANASIIDIGGESTNPNILHTPSTEEELDRIVSVVDYVSNRLGAIVSVDTSNPVVMSHVIDAGASMINDVRALHAPGSLEVFQKNTNIAVVLMHSLCQKNQSMRITEDVLSTVKHDLKKRIQVCTQQGIKLSQLILDPGFGSGFFGKTPMQDLQLIKRFKELKIFNLPLLGGVSRKSFMTHIIDKKVEDRLWMSLGAAAWLVISGVNIIRVHDVAETSDMIRMIEAIQCA
ncbi:MAG: dihydropteroate synthase [Endozoicomonadaceae bacterium]|nr:dihydropteroate synthase [Endozoicomonadaceae bacterium]MBE8233173.1 dihydropteroate synthase [Endozoicomonadaceae bacterium]